MTDGWTVLTEDRLELGEGPRWFGDGALTCVDLLVGDIRRYRPDGDGWQDAGRDRFEAPVGAVAAGVTGRLLATGTGFARQRPDGSVDQLARLPESPETYRMNDGACDPQGRMVAGLMSYAAAPGSGRLVRLEYERGAGWMAQTLLASTTISNGLGWSPDGARLYFVDSLAGTLRSFAYGDSLADERVVASFISEDGVPDGICVDTEGAIWVALWDGREVRRYASNGALLERFQVPVRRPTGVCLGGIDLRTLFVTTARYGLAEPAPLDGAILSRRVPVPGLKPTPWYDGEVAGAVG